MELPALLCSDLHLTSNPKDAYRLGIFSWLADECDSRDVKTLGILGDITDAKEGHSAELVTAIVEGIVLVSRYVDGVVINLGNHDYLRRGFPFFRFLEHLPKVTFVWDKPKVVEGWKTNSLWLPYTKCPAEDWEGLDMSHFNYVLMHQTVSGSIASNGMKMDGEPLPDLSRAGKVYSGDIHVPQVVGCVEYVGSPYHVHFGDKFTPRCVLLDDRGTAHDLHYPCLSRYVLTASSLTDLRTKLRAVRPGDQIRVRMELTAEESFGWETMRGEVAALVEARGAVGEGVELKKPKSSLVRAARAASSQMTPEERVFDYVLREGLGADAFDVAMEVLE